MEDARHTMNGLNAVEPLTLTRLTWRPLCWVYFTTIGIKVAAYLRPPWEPRLGTVALSPSFCLFSTFMNGLGLSSRVSGIYLEENV